MRGTLPGLHSPHPLGRGLPAVYQDEDPFTMRMTEAFDELLAPVISTLDCLPAYFDAAVAPEDFVDWLADWVGIDLDETWDLPLRRQVVAGATDLHARRGTAAGLADQVRLVTGGEVEVHESGGTAWSVDAGSALPGSRKPTLLVRVRVPDPSAVDPVRLERLVTAVKPAHVPHSLEILPQKGGGATSRGGSGGSGGGGRGGAPASDASNDASSDAGSKKVSRPDPQRPAPPSGQAGPTPARSGTPEPDPTTVAEDAADATTPPTRRRSQKGDA